MLDAIIDGLLDTLKILPYLLITFIILEFMEHKLGKRHTKILSKNKKYGPIIGGVLGALPQCGFSVVASNLFSNRVITVGTLVAVFLSTSDEMLPIMISEHINIILMLKIILFKIIVGITVGVIVDLIYKSKIKDYSKDISDMCEKDHCDCGTDGIILSSVKHTIKIGIFILVANLLINLIIFNVGEENLSRIIIHKNVLTYFGASLIGLIPNCASSVIMTELYLSKLISIGNLLSGLLTGSGLGILLLFRYNKNLKENIFILLLIYFVGSLIGMMVDFVL